MKALSTPHRIAIVIAALLPVLGFAALAKVPKAKHTRLRITNQGRYPVQDLVVLFPGSQIHFGTVQPGITTAYRDAPKGVYRYAAFEYKVQGKVWTQPVTDWVGEKPMPGAAFTYTIIVHPQAHSRLPIETVKVTKDR